MSQLCSELKVSSDQDNLAKKKGIPRLMQSKRKLIISDKVDLFFVFVFSLLGDESEIFLQSLPFM